MARRNTTALALLSLVIGLAIPLWSVAQRMSEEIPPPDFFVLELHEIRLLDNYPEDEVRVHLVVLPHCGRIFTLNRAPYSPGEGRTLKFNKNVRDLEFGSEANAVSLRYFIPMILLLASHIIWYFSTKMAIISLYDLVGIPYVSPVQQVAVDYNLPAFGVLQLLFAVPGIVIAGLIADVRERKTAFSTAVLAFGLLAIFGQTFYRVAPSGTQVDVFALPLLGTEIRIQLSWLDRHSRPHPLQELQN